MKPVKCITAIACIILSIDISYGQTWKEWFSQKKTQKEYLVKQIAALKVYASCLKEGYDIAQKGLNIVSDIKGRNFHDHQDQFGSLKIVKEDLVNGSRTHLILNRQVAIMNEFRKLKRVCRSSGNLTEEEIRYVDLVYSSLLIECERIVTTLQNVVTDDTFQMTDDERIERVGEIYQDMNGKYAFTRAFCSSTRALIMRRGAEKFEIESVRELNGAL